MTRNKCEGQEKHSTAGWCFSPRRAPVTNVSNYQGAFACLACWIRRCCRGDSVLSCYSGPSLPLNIYICLKTKHTRFVGRCGFSETASQQLPGRAGLCHTDKDGHKRWCRSERQRGMWIPSFYRDMPYLLIQAIIAHQNK